MVARGSLATWEREHRARLAMAEEEGELARMRAELGDVEAHLAGAQRERERLLQSLGAAQKVLQDLRGSRGYRMMRWLGRWESLERGMRRVDQ